MRVKRSIRAKLVGFVAISVMIAFILCGVFSSLYFYNVLKEQVVQAEAQKLTQTANQLRYIQEEVDSLARAISVDERIQNTLLKDYDGDAFAMLVSQMDVTEMLSSHLNMKPHFYNAHIIAADGTVYSSNRYQGAFVLADEGWYTRFKELGKNAGFTEAHSIYVAQKNQTVEAISYVLSFRDMYSGQEVLGDIVVNVDFAQLAYNAQVDRSLLQGYALFNGQGRVILREGQFSDQPVRGTGIEEQSGSIRIVNDGMLDGWFLVSEVSRTLLLQKLQFVWIFFTVTYIGVMALLILFLYRAIRKLTHPIDQLAQLAAQVGGGDFSARVHIDTGDELSALGDRFNAMTEELDHHLQQAVEYEKTTREMELNRLMLQINPHFIYNTLNSIVYLAQEQGNDDVVTFSRAFISLLQDTLTVEKGGFYTSLGQELRNVRNYLLLQAYRYPDRFDAVYKVSPDTEDCQVPGVLLQPLVENALFHGLFSKEDKGLITISAQREGDEVVITVTDDGVGMTAETLHRLMHSENELSGRMRTIGVANVQKRIEHAYGEEYALHINSAPDRGTCITINIPYRPTESHPDHQEENT